MVKNSRNVTTVAFNNNMQKSKTSCVGKSWHGHVDLQKDDSTSMGNAIVELVVSMVQLKAILLLEHV
jgi:hypothetical protein